MIRLQSGQLKRVEDMSTEDFVLSAAMKSDLIICNSTVVRIQEIEKDRQVLVTFAVGEQRIQVSVFIFLRNVFPTDIKLSWVSVYISSETVSFQIFRRR